MSLFDRLLGKPTSKKNSAPDEAFYFDPLADDFIRDPYPILTFLRNEQPLHRARSGAWILTRYQDIKKALADSRLGNAPSSFAVVHRRNSEKYLCAKVANNILPFLDPPAHTARRDVISKSFFHFAKGSSEQSGLPDIDQIARRLLDAVSDKTEFDVIHDYGTPFTTEVMCRFMGFPIEDKLTLTAWSEYFLYLFSIIPDQTTLEKTNEALSLFRDYVKKLIRTKRAELADDWTSLLLQYNDKYDAPLNEEDIVDNVMLVFADGVENVDRMLGTTVKLLCEHPQLRERLLGNSSLLEKFVDECLRYESPVQFIGRVAREDIIIHEQTIKADSVILLMLGSANRDEQQFSDADCFLIDRDNRSMLTFGRGAHACLGRALVRQQLAAALSALIQHFPRMKLKEQNLQWEKRLGHRWLTGLVIETR